MEKFSQNIKVEFISIYLAGGMEMTGAIKISIHLSKLTKPEIHIVSLEQIYSQVEKGDSLAYETSDAVFDSLFHSLTCREQEVLILVSKGKSSNEIAENLYISVNTVKNHRRNVKKKLKLYNQLVYSKFLRYIDLNIHSI